MQTDNYEIIKFNNLAHEWWNIDGEFKTLHHINPVRLKFITDHIDLSDKKVIDIGCGGGILTESIAKCGVCSITGIDLAPQSIEVAKLHLYESGLDIDYKCVDIEIIADELPQCFDVVFCMEMLEHVNNPSVIIQQCSKLLKPGGYAFFSTLNRTLKSYALGVIAAEYILKLIPKGT
ncbi:MAG: bifunctional 2-polyprenyl-6-hydroxyphenol methylase/3-demethylubiquinol 3-O-methyltransferase UbiG, partial [Burkholderiales bacterium]|nr:bifunctional 2-polyprenyl-6-hydroxyphenol methylase/3-demethylubiquinol 3-O-methyltransferase UbiG [Burkholderiales bacterium]